MNIKTEILKIAKSIKAVSINEDSSFWNSVYFPSLKNKEYDFSIDSLEFKKNLNHFANSLYQYMKSKKTAYEGFGDLYLVISAIHQNKEVAIQVHVVKNGFRNSTTIRFDKHKVNIGDWARFSSTDKTIKEISKEVLESF